MTFRLSTAAAAARLFRTGRVALLGLLALASAAHAQKPTPVIVMPAKSDRFVDRVEALGTLRANETVILTAPMTEMISAIHFDDGQRVQAGTVLAELSSREELAQLEEARASLAEAERQYERVKPLAERGSSPESVLDERRRQFETAKARLEAIRARLKDRQIVAPFAGVVGLRDISVGALVEPGDTITRISDDSVMKLDFTVPATYLADLRVGLPIVAKARALGDRTFEGTVSGLDAQIDPATRSIMVRARLPNPERLLKPGLLMTVELLKNPRQTVVVAEEALIPLGRDNYVLVVDRSGETPVADRRRVEVGGRRPGEVEILKGVKAGDLVVTHGTLRVQSGQQVSITAIEEEDEPLDKLLGNGGAGSS